MIIILGLVAGFLTVGLILVLYREHRLKKSLRQISKKMQEIIAQDTDEKVMLFTHEADVIELLKQINRILEDRQIRKAEFAGSQMQAKRMLSNISHDIRTPLTVILGYLEIMQAQSEIEDKTEKERNMLMKVKKKAQEMMNLINQFFSLAKLEAGDTELKLCCLDINEICRACILDYYQILTEKEFTVDISLLDHKGSVYADEAAVKRILTNLITNAIRYGRDGKYIGLTIEEKEDQIQIQVSDRGHGIRQDQKAHVFDRLYTMDDSRNKNIEGNGLGLTIARNLAVSMGGDITVESEPDVSTTFTVTFPALKI